jgi:hypothetical protein
MGKDDAPAPGILRRLGRIVGRRQTEDLTRPDSGKRGSVERRRAPRILVEELDDGGRRSIVVRVGAGSYPIRDLSVSGLSFSDADLARSASPGTIIEALLVIDTDIAKLSLKIAAVRGDIVGCAIVAADERWRKIAGDFLDPVCLGKKLREIDARFVNNDPDAPPLRWFQGGPGCDLYVWSHADGKVATAQLFFMGQVVEWSEVHGVRTGQVPQLDDDNRRPLNVRSELFELTSPPNAESLAVARAILAAANLPAAVCELVKRPGPR